jgi:hypothetical protein
MGRLQAHIRLPLSSTLAASLLAFAQSATAADESLYSANTPSGLEAGDNFAALNHGFGVKLFEEGKFNDEVPKQGFGFKQANAGALVRSRVWKGLELRGYSSLRLPEYGLGATYTVDLSPIQLMAGAEGFTLLEGDNFRKSTYSFLALSTGELADAHLIPSVGVGYDDYHRLGAVVVGLSVPFLDEHALIGEYHARLNREERDPDIGKVDSWNFGYRWTPGRHQFALLISNTAAITERQANLGSLNNDINWAFRITRYFYEKEI